jgi:D-alanyl-D-alanine carboxypeptidase
MEESLQNIIVSIPPPYVTAKWWGVLDGDDGSLLFGRNEHVPKEVASITKIMTAYLCYRIMKRFKINPKKRMVRVTRYSSGITGTTARLKEGDMMSVFDLLHGVMLPSGNDAATAIAEHFALIIKEDRERQAISSKNQRLAQRKDDGEWEFNSVIYGSSGIDCRKEVKSRHLVKLFVEEMNKTASMLGMNNTVFSNPHGMWVAGNTSTISDVGIISSQAMKVSMIRHIVKKK